MENLADVPHLETIHGPADFLGTVVKKAPFYDLIIKYFHYKFDVEYKICAEHYILQFFLDATYHLGPFQIKFQINWNLIGPNLVYARIYMFGKLFMLNYFALISDGPYNQRFINHFYYKKNSLLSYLLSKYMYYLNMTQVTLIIDYLLLNKPNKPENSVLDQLANKRENAISDRPFTPALYTINLQSLAIPSFISINK